MCERDAWLSSFISHRGLYKWLRCPSGLVNLAASFVRTLNVILKPISEFAEPYIDDIGVHSQTWETHINHIVQYLTTMRKANLTWNIRKTLFAQPHIKMVGHIIGSGSQKPDPAKLTVLQQLERPVTKTQLKRVLGMFGY